MNKAFLIYLILLLLFPWFLTGNLYSQDLTIRKVGEWGKGEYSYKDIFVQGNYAYCAAVEGGLDIVDITNPAQPVLLGNCNTTGYANGVYVSDKYAYLEEDSEGLQIIDVSNPMTPIWLGNYNHLWGIHDVVVNGNYAYTISENGLMVIDISNPPAPALIAYWYKTGGSLEGFSISGKYAVLVQSFYTPGITMSDSVKGGVDSRLSILDISTPSSPTAVGYYDEYNTWMIDVYVSGTYAYVLYYGQKLEIFDISNPSRPRPVGESRTLGYTYTQGVYVRGNYAYITEFYYTEGNYTNPLHLIEIFDVSDPASPKQVDKYEMPGELESVHFDGDYMYVAEGYEGLHVLSLSNPSEPKPVGRCNNLEYSKVIGMIIRGNYAYVVDGYRGLMILDISIPSAPTLLGTCDTIIPGLLYRSYGGIVVSGNYAYVANYKGGLRIIDISNMRSPIEVGQYKSDYDVFEVYVKENYAYIAGGLEGLKVIDVSNPAVPIQVGSCKTEGSVLDVWVSGNYAYVPVYLHGLRVIDISQPASPRQVGLTTIPRQASKVCVSGNHAYVVDFDEGLFIFDVSTPAMPVQVGNYSDISFCSNMYIDGKYLYLACGNSGGLKVLDISNPALPTLVGVYDNAWGPIGPVDVHVVGNNIYLAEGQFFILQSTHSDSPPQIALNRKNIYFSTNKSGAATGSQSFSIENSGGSTLNWSVSMNENQNWLTCTPTYGIDSGNVVVSVNPSWVSVGTYHSTITVSAPFAVNSPQYIDVTLNIFKGGETSKPFGEFAAPTDGAVVSSSIPITGWALDDVGVRSVQIFREEGGGLIYIGDAVFVEGARPDVEQAYPAYPNNYRAGWGYMMLTNFLPGGGNGPFKIYAIATDLEGNQVTLGARTIICDNANAVKPFGTIDTPSQGGLASGSNFINFGWVLTPLPNIIPTDGSTIQVWVDGVFLGNPVYNQYREDIAGLFPDYNNSNGAVGYFYLDTTLYKNGVHTIQWTAVDDAGNIDGIGSRYFTIQNAGESRTAAYDIQSSRFNVDLDRSQTLVDHSRAGRIRSGYDNNEPYEIYPDEKGIISIEIKELEHLEIRFFDEENSTLKNITPLPIGSTLDAEQGIFYWSPGPGFVGNYRLVFIEEDTYGHQASRNVLIKIRPKF
jgi:hypothetical protein